MIFLQDSIWFLVKNEFVSGIIYDFTDIVDVERYRGFLEFEVLKIHGKKRWCFFMDMFFIKNE